MLDSFWICKKWDLFLFFHFSGKHVRVSGEFNDKTLNLLGYVLGCILNDDSNALATSDASRTNCIFSSTAS